MPIPVILAILGMAAAAGVVAGVAIAVAKITYTLLMDTFRAWSTRVRNNPRLLPVSVDVSKQIASGNYKRIYTGLFDTVGEQFVDTKLYESSQIDDQVAAAHRDDQIVVWN